MAKKILKKTKKKPLRIGVVTALFNREITERLEIGAVEFLTSVGAEVLKVQVPGAVEIPLACWSLFNAGCDGVVALGAVIRGDTSHYDVVCNSVERGVTELMLQEKKPIGFGVLTCENEDQAFARADTKGTESAQVVLEMIQLLQDLKKI